MVPRRPLSALAGTSGSTRSRTIGSFTSSTTALGVDFTLERSGTGGLAATGSGAEDAVVLSVAEAAAGLPLAAAFLGLAVDAAGVVLPLVPVLEEPDVAFRSGEVAALVVAGLDVGLGVLCGVIGTTDSGEAFAGAGSVPVSSTAVASVGMFSIGGAAGPGAGGDDDVTSTIIDSAGGEFDEPPSRMNNSSAPPPRTTIAKPAAIHHAAPLDFRRSLLGANLGSAGSNNSWAAGAGAETGARDVDSTGTGCAVGAVGAGAGGAISV